jgi:hypothetical protein
MFFSLIKKGRTMTSTARVRLAAAMLTAGAAGIHFGVIPDHAREWELAAVFFAVAALLQLVWAAAVYFRPSRTILLAGAIGNAAMAGLWVITRTIGLPFGPRAGTPESAGLLDIFTAVIQVAAAALTVRLLHDARTAVARTRDARSWRVGTIVATTLALTVFVGLVPASGSHEHHDRAEPAAHLTHGEQHAIRAHLPDGSHLAKAGVAKRCHVDVESRR